MDRDYFKGIKKGNTTFEQLNSKLLKESKNLILLTENQNKTKLIHNSLKYRNEMFTNDPN